MSKKRFVEFYLTAVLKAATNDRVRAYYIYHDPVSYTHLTLPTTP